jgi:hypothetical protein
MRGKRRNARLAPRRSQKPARRASVPTTTPFSAPG